MEYDRTTFFPSNRNEKVRNCPGRKFSVRPSGTMKRRVLASGVCCVIFANFRIRESETGEPAGRTAWAATACAGAGLVGRRTTKITTLKKTIAMKPRALVSLRVDGAGSSGTGGFCVTMLRPADEAAAT